MTGPEKTFYSYWNVKIKISSSDKHMFKITQSMMDWEKIISCSVRKLHTLTELVLEAKKNVNNPSKSGKHKKHPDLPKNPLTAYLRFFKEMRPQYLQKHPKVSNQELTKVLPEEYRKLPEQLKLKYGQDFQKEEQEFQEKMALFKEQHPNVVQNSKKPDVPKGSQSKVPKKFQENLQKHEFHQDLWSSRELKVVPPRERMVEISRRWQQVPQDQQAEELQTQYKVDLDLWLKTLSPEEYADYRKATCAKHKNMSVTGGPNPKIRRMDLQSPSSGNLQGRLGEDQGLQAAESESSDTTGEHSPASRRSEENEEEEEGSFSAPSSEDEDGDSEPEDHGSSSSSSGNSSDSDSD
ncbi:hypothetical protein FD754_000128 [Muntiacus muntjak]|uniref:HMG box domain-containing protein n=1 Tax=Muntiacus muntjak TaxID=9888 RepID=A0A5N3W332_MUNMU|nr:hypothetical protein FD754_000128 [Muntiacus muntjak]